MQVQVLLSAPTLSSLRRNTPAVCLMGRPRHHRRGRLSKRRTSLGNPERPDRVSEGRDQSIGILCNPRTHRRANGPTPYQPGPTAQLWGPDRLLRANGPIQRSILSQAPATAPAFGDRLVAAMFVPFRAAHPQPSGEGGGSATAWRGESSATIFPRLLISTRSPSPIQSSRNGSFAVQNSPILKGLNQIALPSHPASFPSSGAN